MKLVLTCEHAFTDIPEEYLELFSENREVLKTHEAFDLGAFDVFQQLKQVADESYFQEIGRLLVETNRSVWHKSLHSRFTKDLSKEEKNKILSTFYYPYREKVESSIKTMIAEGNYVFHLSVHSFTPLLNGVLRNADIGLLYDPKRIPEKDIAKKFKELINTKEPQFKVRYNYPYLGKSDGFTTSLRKIFPQKYMGIELEINQKWVKNNLMQEDIKMAILFALQEIKKV
ncbi:MAG: N-formylglutamate amidohydrolase [Christiangramia sp.]|nr:N-formylglutamate amidohydrolase [Christiangramia sp.]